MNIIHRITDAVTGPLTRGDRPRWAAARTMPDLCELTALWLEGRIASQPGYYGPVDVDEEDAPGLTRTLAALNRAGFLTYNSQAGFDGIGADGARWQQRAAATGFATENTIGGILDALTGTPYGLIAHPLQRRPRRPRPGFTVTFRDGRPYTTFGEQVTASVIGGELYAGCHREALDAVCDAQHVTVYDPATGRNDLWPVLRAAAETHGGGR